MITSCITHAPGHFEVLGLSRAQLTFASGDGCCGFQGRRDGLAGGSGVCGLELPPDVVWGILPIRSDE